MTVSASHFSSQFDLSHNVHTDSRAQQNSYLIRTGGSFLGRQSGRIVKLIIKLPSSAQEQFLQL